MQWLEEDFLGYLEEWEKSVAARKGFSKTEKNKMLLSDATRSGLKFTGTGVCMYVCMYVCICVCVCMRACVRAHVCAYYIVCVINLSIAMQLRPSLRWWNIFSRYTELSAS